MRLPARRPGRLIQDIAEEFAITVGGTNKVVDRAEAAGCCRRRANPNDRRSSLVELTPAGTRLTKKATEVFEAELARRIGSVVPEQARERFAVPLSALRAAGQAMSKQESAR